MPRGRKVPDIANDNVPMRTALSPEARENQLIALATDRAEQQLRDGTASSQVIVHYLKMGSAKERAEREVLKNQIELLKAKTESLNGGRRSDEAYERVIQAMRGYRGMDEDDSDLQ